MRHTPTYVITDPLEVRRLIGEHPWATIVSPTSNGMVASHYPVMLENRDDQISLVSHFGRPDDELHELGQHEVLVIIQGPHGYISSSWYPDGDNIPTWNHATAHLYGTPEILSDEENYRVLSELVDHFEHHVEHPVSLADDEAGARRAAKGTVGLRIVIDRFDARLKMSQNEKPEVHQHIVDELNSDGTYASPQLAAEMTRVRPSDPE